MRMIAILHGKGFHGLRLYPRHTGAGAYRFYIFPSRYSDKTGLFYNGTLPGARMAGHSNTGSEHYFDRIDGKGLSAHQLAIRFIEEFPELIEQSKLNDYAYVGWFASLLARSEYGAFPMVSDYGDEIDMITFDHKNDGVFPMPPPPSHQVDYDLPASLVGIKKARAYFLVLQRQLGVKSELTMEEIAKEARQFDFIAREKRFHSYTSDLDLGIEMSSLLPRLNELFGNEEDAKSVLVQFIEIERKSISEDQ